MSSIYKKYIMKAALIWAGCFVLLVFVYMLMLAPQKKSKNQIEKQLDEKQQMYESVLKATQEETKIQLKEQIERLQNDLGNFVIDFEDSANLTFDISQIANEKEAASFSIKAQKKDKRRDSKTPDYDYISEDRIDIKFTSGFNQFAAFLNALERNRPVVFIDKFTIARSKEGKSDHQVSMDVAVFVRKRQGG
ncbi:MAG: hypothetical protein ACYS0C_02490 [Planctomycetota bacterium]|jgi:lipopolysaccharide export LptBFGC system permease protein LptF